MKKKFAEGGIFREGMEVPQDIDGGSAPMKRPMPKAPMKRPMPKGGGIFREGMEVPQDIDGGSAPKPRKPKKYAHGGVTRADGIAKRGHTKGKMV